VTVFWLGAALGAAVMPLLLCAVMLWLPEPLFAAVLIRLERRVR
jgi:hypothetical protein